MCCLVGGPDWPTSVLTGIMRLSLPQMLLGTLPVFFLIAPSCVAGAMLYKSDTNSLFGSLEVISVGIAVIVQSGALLGAIHYIAKMAVNQKDELKKMAPDEEVVKLEMHNQCKLRASREINAWQHLSSMTRVLHVIALVLMVFSCYCFQLVGGRCFEEFSITDSINTTLDGDPLNLVTPLGRVPCFAFLFSCCYLVLFTCIQNRRVSRMMTKSRERVQSVNLTREQERRMDRT